MFVQTRFCLMVSIGSQDWKLCLYNSMNNSLNAERIISIQNMGDHGFLAVSHDHHSWFGNCWVISYCLLHENIELSSFHIDLSRNQSDFAILAIAEREEDILFLRLLLRIELKHLQPIFELVSQIHFFLLIAIALRSYLFQHIYWEYCQSV